MKTSVTILIIIIAILAVVGVTIGDSGLDSFNGDDSLENNLPMNDILNTSTINNVSNSKAGSLLIDRKENMSKVPEVTNNTTVLITSQEAKQVAYNWLKDNNFQAQDQVIYDVYGPTDYLGTGAPEYTPSKHPYYGVLLSKDNLYYGEVIVDAITGKVDNSLVEEFTMGNWTHGQNDELIFMPGGMFQEDTGYLWTLNPNDTLVYRGEDCNPYGNQVLITNEQAIDSVKLAMDIAGDPNVVDKLEYSVSEPKYDELHLHSYYIVTLTLNGTKYHETTVDAVTGEVATVNSTTSNDSISKEEALNVAKEEVNEQYPDLANQITYEVNTPNTVSANDMEYYQVTLILDGDKFGEVKVNAKTGDLITASYDYDDFDELDSYSSMNYD